MRTISLVTGHRLPKPDDETPLLVRALAGCDIATEISIWGEPRDWSTVPLVLVRSPWDHQLPSGRRSEFQSWARRVGAATVLRNPASVLAWNNHQRYLLTITDAAVPTVPTRLIPRGAGLLEQRIVLEQHEGKVMIKPAAPVAGIGAVRAKAESERARAQLASAVYEVDVLVQPFVESVTTEGEISLIYIAGEFSHAVRRTGAKGAFHVGEEHGGAVAGHDASAAERAVADAAMQQVPEATATARVDLLATEAGPLVLRLELIAADLYLRHAPEAADRIAGHVAELLSRPAA